MFQLSNILPERNEIMRSIFILFVAAVVGLAAQTTWADVLELKNGQDNTLIGGDINHEYWTIKIGYAWGD